MGKFRGGPRFGACGATAGGQGAARLPSCASIILVCALNYLPTTRGERWGRPRFGTRLAWNTREEEPKRERELVHRARLCRRLRCDKPEPATARSLCCGVGAVLEQHEVHLGDDLLGLVAVCTENLLGHRLRIQPAGLIAIHRPESRSQCCLLHDIIATVLGILHLLMTSPCQWLTPSPTRSDHAKSSVSVADATTKDGAKLVNAAQRKMCERAERLSDSQLSAAQERRTLAVTGAATCVLSVPGRNRCRVSSQCGRAWCPSFRASGVPCPGSNRT